jgi:hypothetical protein
MQHDGDLALSYVLESQRESGEAGDCGERGFGVEPKRVACKGDQHERATAFERKGF